jgi:hypothetical protein
MDWATISALATGGGTLVLAIATFGSTASANRAARAAERSVLAGMRPLLMPSRLEDPSQKVTFMDDKWQRLPGGEAVADVDESAVYLSASLRSVGNGIAVLHGWRLRPERDPSREMPPVESFTRLTRDLFIAAGEIGFWQGTFRDPSSPDFSAAADAIRRRAYMTVDILYGDFEGGQRMITRFGLNPKSSGEGWILSVGRHWNIDQPDPR